MLNKQKKLTARIEVTLKTICTWNYCLKQTRELSDRANLTNKNTMQIQIPVASIDNRFFSIHLPSQQITSFTHSYPKGYNFYKNNMKNKNQIIYANIFKQGIINKISFYYIHLSLESAIQKSLTLHKSTTKASTQTTFFGFLFAIAFLF